MCDSKYWWPLDLIGEERTAFGAFQARMREEPVVLDQVAASATIGMLTMGMRHHIQGLAVDDRLGSFCHLLNGWGDLIVNGAKLTASLANFTQRGPGGGWCLLQMNPEGEVHPWQTFAYATMAGIAPARILYDGGPTLRDLALGSRALPTRDADEFGHLLYALATIEPDAGVHFSLEGERHTTRQLVAMAVRAHHEGTFRVCRKFHLTEGLCAVAARIEGLSEYREAAQGFLEGQMDVLFAVGALLEHAVALHDARRSPDAGGLVERLWDKLAINPLIENHAYLAGHLMELACLAHGLGYTVSLAHRRAMAYIANALNRLLPVFAGGIAWPLCFLHLGHYRRGLSLLSLLEDRGFVGELSPGDLSAFSVNFDAVAPARLPESPPEDAQRVFRLLAQPAVPRPRFAATIECFRAIAPAGLHPRGVLAHFRRAAPQGWPRALHYELLDDGDEVGVEIHLEDASLRPLAEPLRGLLVEGRARFPDARVDWDDAWMAGRFRVRFPSETAPERVAQAMVDLIHGTSRSLTEAVEQLRGHSSAVALSP